METVRVSAPLTTVALIIFLRGVVIDDKQQVSKMMEEYWNPMWKVSYLDLDVDVQLVMDGVGIDRSAPYRFALSAEERKKADTDKRRYSVGVPIASAYYDASLEFAETEEKKTDK